MTPRAWIAAALTWTSLATAPWALAGCRDPETTADGTTDAASTGTGRPMTSSTSEADATTRDDGTTGGRGSSTANDPDAGVGPGPGPGSSPDGTDSDSRAEGCDFGTLGTPRGEYDFINESICDAEPIDRVGVPFVGTLLITSIDDYNASTPADDQFFGFAPEINAAVNLLHDALDDDLTAQALLPCDFGACSAVVTPLVIPDALAFDPDDPSGFPNGRAPADPVFDRMLAAILLDAEAHPMTTLSDIPLSPADNDVPFADAFPYLAPPHS